MRKKSASASIIAITFIVFSAMTTPLLNSEGVRNIGALMRFRSTADIDKLFSDNNVPVETYNPKHYEGIYYWVAAYPYSGSDTIDVYCFVHWGDVWRVQMLYFALHPATRKLDILGDKGVIVVRDGPKELLRFDPNKN